MFYENFLRKYNYKGVIVLKFNIRRKNMVKVILELTEEEIEIFSNCIETAMDIGHIKNEEDRKRAGTILKKIHKYILDPKV